MSQGREANTAYDEYLKQKALKAEMRRGQGAGSYAAKPEYEQRLSVGRQQSEGPDPAVEAERRFLTQGAVPIERVEQAKRQLSGREVLAIMDPPANVKPKERQAWADSYAADLSSKGISLATAEATGVLGQRKIPGWDKMGDQQKTDADRAEKATRQQLIEAIDARHTTREGNVSQANLAAQQQADKWQADFGGEGIEGNAAAAAKVDQRLIDQRTGFSSVEKAEEGKGQMVQQPDGTWAFDQDQDKPVWTPGANEAKGIAEEKFQTERARLLKEQDDKISEVMADIDKQVADIGSGKIDPNGFYANKSTGERIGIAIAQAMGTFASAYGVKNTANDIIQSAIDRDVQAQIENMKEKRGKLNDSQQLYKRILDSTGSKVAAEEALKLAQFAKVDKDLGAAEAQAHTEKAKIAIQDIRARVRLQNLDRQAEITERTRGTKTTQSKVVPAVAGGYSSGYNPDKDIEAILQKRVGLGTEAAKLDLAVGGAAADEAKARAAAQGKAGQDHGVVTFRQPGTKMADGKTIEIPLDRRIGPEEAKQARVISKAIMDSEDAAERLLQRRGSGLQINDADAEEAIEKLAFANVIASGQGQATADNVAEKAKQIRGVWKEKGIKAISESLQDSKKSLISQYGAKKLRMADVPLASVAAAEPTVKMVGRDGSEHYVPETQAADAFRSGQFGFADPEQRLAVRDSSGTLADLSASQAANLWSKDALAGSASMGAMREAQEAAKYGGIGNTAAAGAIGAANALTLGGGRGFAVQAAKDIFGRDAEVATQDYLRRTEEASPVASMVGEGVGMVIPALFTGGTSAAAQGGVKGALALGGRALSAPTRALGLLGEGAAGLTGRGLALAGAEEGGLLARGLTSAARGAAEMSVYSAADAWSRAKIEDRDLSAEQLMAAAGHGALMGGALGGGLVLGGAALNKTLGGIGAGAKALAERGGKLAEDIGVHIPSADLIRQEQTIKSLAGSNGAKLVKEFTEWSPDLQKRLVGIVEKASDDAGHTLRNPASRAELVTALEGSRKAIGKEYDATLKALDSSAVKQEKALSGINKETGEVGEKLRPNIDTIVERSRADVLSPLMEKLPTWERGKANEIEKIIKGLATESAESGGFTSFERLNVSRQQIRDSIDFAPKSAQERFVNDAKKDLLKTVNAEFERAADALSALDGAEHSVRWSEANANYKAARMASDLAKKGADAELKNRSFGLGSMIAGGSGGNIGATAGAMLAGPVGAFVGGVAGNAAGAVMGNLNKRFGNQVAATLARRVVETDVLRAVDSTLRETMGASVTSLVRGVKAPSSAAVGSLVSKADAAQTRSKQADYEKRRQALVNFAAAPDATLARTLAGAPAEVVAGVKAQTTKGAEYLQSIAPRPVGTGNPLQPTSDVDKVDPAARDRWLRSAKAVDDPMSVLSDARSGSLTPEAVAAVKAVYPRIYGQIQGQVMAELAKSDRPLSYSRAQQLSILLGVPADVSLTPAYLAAVQNPPTQAKPLKAGKIEVKNEPDKLGSQETEST